MRVIWLAALCGGAAAFQAGPALRQVPRRHAAPAALAVDGLHDALQQGMHGASLLLADRPQTAEAIRAAEGTLGWWGTYIKTVEDGLITLHDLLSANGVPNAYGLSIFLFVLGVKLVTLPLNWKQIDSSAQMKAIKPQQDLLNKWYADNTQFKNNEIGTLFEKVDVNPLAGCLPSLAQIPVFLGVYYSVTAIAKAKIFDEGFLWIPNLSGPISDRTEGLTWLTQGWVDGHPRLGWHDTLCYVSIPLILVCAQTLSLYLLGSFDALDESENSKTAAVALRFLPLMIGWFSLNAPSGLGLYWTFNNILTTATTVTVKKLVEKPLLEVETAALLAQVGPRQPVRPPPDDAAAEWVPAGAPSAAVAAAAESSSSAVTAPAAESA